MLSITEENYLKAIFSLIEDNKSTASTSDISNKIKTTAPTVTDMLKRLSVKNLIMYKPYQGVYFTDKGLAEALQLVRKHRVWETFLFNTLGFDWGEVHEIAEELEHVKSASLINKLDAFLGFPKFDPHGDPIPDKSGKLIFLEDVTIADLEIHQKGCIVGLKDTSTDFLDYLDTSKLTIGQPICIKTINDFNQAIEIQVGDAHLLNISHAVAHNIYIKKISTQDAPCPPIS